MPLRTPRKGCRRSWPSGQPLNLVDPPARGRAPLSRPPAGRPTGRGAVVPAAARHSCVVIRTCYAGHAVDTMATGTGPVILIVDDSEDVRSLLAILLIRLGYRVLEALDGLAALDL